MPNHPNRNKSKAGIPPASPTPDQVREMRGLAGLTQEASAKLIHGAVRTWKAYEADSASPDSRTMPAAAWDLYLRRCRAQGAPIAKKYCDYLDSADAQDAKTKDAAHAQDRQ